MIRSFVKNGRLMSLVITLLVVAGLGALTNLPRTEDPRITNRTASVITLLPGASAERVEVLISEKIEQKLRKLPEINLLTSNSRPGISIVQVKLQDEITDTKPIWSRVRDLLNDLNPSLPNGTQAPILEDDRGYAFTQIIALNWQGVAAPDVTILGRYANELQNKLKLVHGTDLVTIFGQGSEEVLVELDPIISSQLNLSVTDISEKILNGDAKVSAGQLTNPLNQMQIELVGALHDTDRISNIAIKVDNNGNLMRLGDIADIRKTVNYPPTEIAMVNNQQAVVVATRMLPNLRIDQWSNSVQQTLAEFTQTLPDNVSLEVIFDQSSYTETRLSDLVSNIAVGFAIIAVVLLVTLGWQAALIVALSLPLTVLFTLSVMNFYGLPIHQMSVTGLVVALGIMVDNAIVMADTVKTNRENGQRRLDAVSNAVNHLWLPLLGSTLTTVLAFMPIVLMPGPAGEFVGGIALSVIFSLVGSYIISHTIVAGLAGRFISQHKTKGVPRWYQVGINLPALNHAFVRLLSWALLHRKTVITIVFCLPLLGFIAAKQLQEQFFPASDRDMFQIELFLPSQSSIINTKRVSTQLTSYLKTLDGIDDVRWFIGKNAPSFYYNLIPTKDGAQYYGQGMVTATSFEAANSLIPQIQKTLDDMLPEAQILVRKLEQGPPFAAPVELRIFGPNLDRLKTIGDDIRAFMADTQDITHSRSTLQPGTPKVWVDVNEAEANLVGLSLVQVAQQLNTTLSGQKNGSIIEATESMPVRVRIGDQQRDDLAALENINIVNPSTKQSIPLTAIATLEVKPSRGAIPHRDGVRVNVIEGYIRAGVLPSVVLKRVKDKMADADYQLHHGYRIEFGGESAERNKAVGKLMASVGLILTLLLTVVVLSFNSFRLSAIIFLSAFQSIGLGLLSVYIFDYPFGFTVIIGLLGLMGLAINAAIVIIAELKMDEQAIQGDSRAIIRCVQSCARHISSTTITTVGGFLPLILAGGGFWPPFAVAVAGGTVLTTILSFIFVPAAFSLLSQRKAFELTTQPTLTHAV
ncbi:MAG: efflux RND transporter permease subunit [Cognaticolwellia sp.]